MTERSEVLLFDLGGVLLDFVGIESLHALTGGRFELEEIRRRWPESPALRKFETGKSSGLEFARDFTAEWELAIDPPAFLEMFTSWTRGPLDGAIALLESLDGRFTLACLTNINAAYWLRIRDDMGFGRLFRKCYASHEIGLLKPDAGIYRHVVEDLGRRPAEIVFFDDTIANVEAARALGINAHHVCGVAALRDQLADLGFN